MKIFKKILAFVAAYSISFGFLVMFVLIDPEHFRSQHYVFSQILISIELIVVFGSPIILTCWFFPQPKKNSVLFSTIPAFLFTVFMIVYTVVNRQTDNLLEIISFVSVYSAFGGICLGVIISYLIFKNKGWVNPAVQTELIEVY